MKALSLSSHLFVFVCAFAAHATERGPAIETSPVTVADLVRFSSIGDPKHLDYYDDSSTARAAFSPDGLHVAVIVSGGNPERRTNDAQLLIYRTCDLLNNPKPFVLASFASAGNNRPMALLRWLPDNETLMFAATQSDRPSQVYRVNIRTRALEPVTRETGLLVLYELDANAKRMLTLGYPSLSKGRPDCKTAGCRVTDGNLWAALDINKGVGAGGASSISFYDLDSGRTKRLMSAVQNEGSIDQCEDRLEGGLSPDGKFALRQCSLRKRPRWWREYTADPQLLKYLEEENPVYAQLLLLIDIDNDRMVALGEAPSLLRSRAPKPIWIDGGRGLILPGVLESLVDVDAAERRLRAASRAILLIDPVTRATTRIARMDSRAATVVAALWDAPGQTITVEAEDVDGVKLPPLSLRRRGKQWLPAKTAAQERQTTRSIQLIVEESLNDRPVLVAVERGTARRKRLLDPNPWLDQRQLGRVEDISWRLKDGGTWRAGLYYPPNYQPGRRYPLMLQNHGFEPKLFSMHGLSRLFTARALAAHDIVVLQVHETFDRYGPTEWLTVQDGYESAIDRLDKLGLIDRQRVGIQGWSRTGPHMGYTLTHSEYPFAAGAFTATADFGWYYRILSGFPGLGSSLYGAEPKGAGLAKWLEFSPSFNINRVRTPMFLWGGAAAQVSLWDWYVELHNQDKPVEFWYAEDELHEIYRVGPRMRMNQLLVDWFRFWLKDEERTQIQPYNGETVEFLQEQYVRWHDLRERQTRILAQPREPLLNWHSTPVEPR